MNKHTDYEIFDSTTEANHRLLQQEAFILEAVEKLCEAVEFEGITKTELANRLGKSKGFVSQVLAGGRNLTLRTIADIASAVGHEPRIDMVRSNSRKRLRDISLVQTLELHTGMWACERSEHFRVRSAVKSKHGHMPEVGVQGVA